MDSSLSLTIDQVDIIDRSLNKAMALARVLANCGPGQRPVSDPPEAVDVFLVMQLMVEELSKIHEITKKLGRKLPE